MSTLDLNNKFIEETYLKSKRREYAQLHLGDEDQPLNEINNINKLPLSEDSSD